VLLWVVVSGAMLTSTAMLLMHNYWAQKGMVAL
jgi:hypothetical protein